MITQDAFTIGKMVTNTGVERAVKYLLKLCPDVLSEMEFRVTP